jgi:hypothetical protein
VSPVVRVDVPGAAIVVGPDAAEVGAAVREAVARGERIGALVGQPGDPEVQRALDEMAEELYGSDDANS